jgi:predicted GNAT family acetyltransferase
MHEVPTHPVPPVRRVRPGDGPLLRALRLEMLADTPIAFAETLDSARTHPLRRWIAQAERNASGDEKATYVAESGDRFVAAATGLADGARTWVVSVYVAPDHRGNGLVGQLIEEVGAWSAAAGRDQLVLEVAAENPRAVAAYARLGFTPTGESSPHPLYPEVTEQVMVRPASAS